MLDLINPGNFDFFARYLLAGLIIIWIRSNYLLARRPPLTEMVAEAVIFSLLNQLLFLTLAALLPTIALPPRGTFFLEVLVLPVLLGLLLGVSLSRGWFNAAFRRLSIPVQPVSRAYDFAFAAQDAESFAILTYSDGTEIFGYFGDNSFTATGVDHSDIYLERLYEVAVDGRWTERHPARGAWASLTDLRSIEFLGSERTDDDKTPAA